MRDVMQKNDGSVHYNSRTNESVDKSMMTLPKQRSPSQLLLFVVLVGKNVHGTRFNW